MTTTTILPPSAQIAERALAEIATLDEQHAQLSAQVATIDERLAQLAEAHRQRVESGRVAYERREVARLRVEQARSLALTARGTEAEGQALGDLTSLEMQLEQAEKTYHEIAAQHALDHAHDTAESLKLQADRHHLQLKLDALPSKRRELTDVQTTAHQRAGEELHTEFTRQARELVHLREISLQAAKEAEEALATLNEQAREHLTDWPALRRQYRLDFEQVDDRLVQRAQTLLAYRKALRQFVTESDFVGGPLAFSWFFPVPDERAYPSAMDSTIKQIETALARHINDVRARM